MKKLSTLREALSDPDLLAHALPGESWASWRILLIAAVGEALTDAEREIFKVLTGRDTEPGEMVETFLTVAGRRSGKSRAMAVLCVYLATLVDWSEEPSLGERGLALFLAPSERQKLEEGVYTGFSIGGRYLRRWPHRARKDAVTESWMIRLRADLASGRKFVWLPCGWSGAGCGPFVQGSERWC
jgi:hypothetical protein